MQDYGRSAIETDDAGLSDDFLDHVIGYNESLSATGRYGCVAEADGDYAVCPPAQDISEFQLQQIVKFLFEIKGCQGDWDQDCVIDQSELGILLARWGMTESDPNWDPQYDLDESGAIGQGDLGILLTGMSDCPE